MPGVPVVAAEPDAALVYSRVGDLFLLCLATAPGGVVVGVEGIGHPRPGSLPLRCPAAGPTAVVVPVAPRMPCLPNLLITCIAILLFQTEMGSRITQSR
ncbi:hypothetical protein [Parapedobacter sp. 2B3]|uniref:hypothetical protein n=1 Tax=Parapedobacter sp. 2B3 TaxID=3342381 RepID=UPI0035B67562